MVAVTNFDRFDQLFPWKKNVVLTFVDAMNEKAEVPLVIIV
jgi:hypothetical protein